MNLQKDEQAVLTLRGLYQRYGYAPYKMSRWEEYDLYVRNKDFLVSDQVITFSDRSGRLLALKPDVTLSIIKNAPNSGEQVQKLYYNENVYRADKTSGTFKEIMQTGLECVGNIGACEIAEVVLLAAESLAQMGQNFVLDLSHMGLITQVLSESGLSAEEQEEAALQLRQKNMHELKRLCDRAGCLPQVWDQLSALVGCSGSPADVIPDMRSRITGPSAEKALAELETISRILEAKGLADRIRIDFSVASDMKYYSGVVFKGYLEGIPAGILSGGQYDKLLQKMGKQGGAIGFAIYLDMLEGLSENEQVFDVDTVLLHKASDDPVAVIKVAEALRQSGQVLTATAMPADKTCRRVYAFERGEAVFLADNGEYSAT